MRWKNRIAHRFKSRKPLAPPALRYRLVVLRASGLGDSDHEYAELRDAETAMGLLKMGMDLDNLGEFDDPAVAIVLLDMEEDLVVGSVELEPPGELWD